MNPVEKSNLQDYQSPENCIIRSEVQIYKKQKERRYEYALVQAREECEIRNNNKDSNGRMFDYYIGNTSCRKDFVRSILESIKNNGILKDDIQILWAMTAVKEVCDYLVTQNYISLACSAIEKQYNRKVKRQRRNRKIEILLGILADIIHFECKFQMESGQMSIITKAIDFSNKHVQKQIFRVLSGLCNKSHLILSEGIIKEMLDVLHLYSIAYTTEYRLEQVHVTKEYLELATHIDIDVIPFSCISLDFLEYVYNYCNVFMAYELLYKLTGYFKQRHTISSEEDKEKIKEFELIISKSCNKRFSYDTYKLIAFDDKNVYYFCRCLSMLIECEVVYYNVELLGHLVKIISHLNREATHLAFKDILFSTNELLCKPSLSVLIRDSTSLKNIDFIFLHDLFKQHGLTQFDEVVKLVKTD